MDPIIWALIGGMAIVAVVATLYALNRSWGNFPRDTRYRPPTGPSAPGISSGPSSPGVQGNIWDAPASPAVSPTQGGIWDALANPTVPPIAELPDPESWVVPIQHPMIRRAAEQALERGGPNARYLVRQGDQIAFDFGQISDLTQRRQAYTLMRRFADGQDMDIRAMMQLFRQLFTPQ